MFEVLQKQLLFSGEAARMLHACTLYGKTPVTVSITSLRFGSIFPVQNLQLLAVQNLIFFLCLLTVKKKCKFKFFLNLSLARQLLTACGGCGEGGRDP